MKTQGTLYFDIETHSRELLYTMQPEQFGRLYGYAWDEGDVVITMDLEELKAQIRKARLIVGHNIHDFDLRGVFGIHSNEPMELADQERVYDTWTHAVLVNPCPRQYNNRHGKLAKEPSSSKIEWAKKWYALDEQAFQLGVPGKTHNLVDLAFEFGDPSFKGEGAKARRVADGLGKIPVDEPRYREYLIGDVEATRAVAKKLLELGPLDAYALREQKIESRKAAISSNGWVVDVEAATARRDELASRKDAILSKLVEDYGFPTEGKQPWRKKEGKEAILKILADHGIDEGSRPHWERTKSGALSLGGKVLIELTEGSEAEDLGKALGELMGQRSLAQLTLDSMYPDGRVHPDISMLQASGRWSTTNPGLTVWTDKGPNRVEKIYYLPDSPDEALVSLDMSNADARGLAWLSGDKEYAKRLAPGADGHLLSAWAVWGKDVVGTDKHDPGTARYRNLGKAGGLSWGYRVGPGKLMQLLGVSFKEAKKFIDGHNQAYRRVVKWQDAMVAYAEKHGYVKNRWGRKMKVEAGREYTVAPALAGQSTTREIMCDFLVALPHNVVRKIKAQIHDEWIVSVPLSRFEACRDYLVRRATRTFPAPPGGQEMHFPANANTEPARNWFEADH